MHFKNLAANAARFLKCAYFGTLIIEVARVVDLKLVFTDWFFLWFDNTNQVVQNPISKFRQSFISFEASLFAWKIENFDELQLPSSLLFYAKILHRHFSYLAMSTKRVFGIFFILFRSWVINKNVKGEYVETRSFWFLQITQDLDKIKSQTPFCKHR